MATKPQESAPTQADAAAETVATKKNEALQPSGVEKATESPATTPPPTEGTVKVHNISLGVVNEMAAIYGRKLCEQFPKQYEIVE